MPSQRLYLVALERYDRKYDPEFHDYDTIPPAEPGNVHALSGFRRDKLVKAPAIVHRSALCRADVKLRLSLVFDPTDPDACQECVSRVLAAQGGWSSESA